jgi:hypothetical protein
MTTTETNESRFSQQEVDRFMMEVVARAGSEDIASEEAAEAFDSFSDMATVAGIVLAWSQEKITVGWDANPGTAVLALTWPHRSRDRRP